MATVYFASARIDENGNARGGKAGDQTGREVMRQPFYIHDGGWIVLRPKDPAMAEKIAWDMNAACDNNLIGYDQNQRDTLLNAAKAVGYDVNRVNVKVETDCSALVRVAVAYAGCEIDTKGARFYTGNMVSLLMATGLFYKLTESKYTRKPDYLRRGDILCTDGPGHTGAILNDGPKAEEMITPVLLVKAPVTPDKPYMANWIVATAPVNVRSGPGLKYGKKVALPKGAGLMYDGAILGEWYAVMYRGARCWVSYRYTKVEVWEKPIVDLSQYNVVKDWAKFSKWISFAIVRVAIRSLRSTGTIKLDTRFKDHVSNLKKYGIPFAVYVYGRAKDAAGAIQEAKKALEWAEPYAPTMYFYDVETATNTHESVQAFVDYVRKVGQKACGTYIGKRWSQVKSDLLDRDAQWSPYYNKMMAGVLFAGQNPSHPHDLHQSSPSAGFPGGPPVVDVSHVNADPATTYKGRSIEWFRSGGKEGA